MALRKKYQDILDRAHADPKFRLNLLKELMRLAIKADPDLLEKAMNKLEQQ